MSFARLTAPYYMKKPTVTDRKVMPFLRTEKRLNGNPAKRNSVVFGKGFVIL